MSDHMADSAIGANRQANLIRLCLIGIALAALGVIVLDFWLIADQEIVAGASPHDDEWFMRKALCWYWLDEGYTHMSFVKEPIYPLFIGLCGSLGLPLRLATEAAYLAAAAFLAWVLVSRRSPLLVRDPGSLSEPPETSLGRIARSVIGLLVFAACALHPMHWSVFQRGTYDALYPSLLMLSIGALLLQFRRDAEPGGWWRALSSGLALGLLWNTRAEWPLALLLLLTFLSFAAFRALRHGPNSVAALRTLLSRWGLTVGMLAVVTLGVMTANWLRWGVFATTDVRASGFTAAYRALVSIRPERAIPRVTVTKEACEMAYQASPSFAELRPYLQGYPGVVYAAAGRDFYDLPPGEIGAGWFLWALRDAAAAAGHCESARDADAFYRPIADELGAAAADGRLPTRAVPPFGVDPCLRNYASELVPSWRRLWHICWWGEEYAETQPELEQDLPPEVKATFDRAACRRSVTRGLEPQMDVRKAIGRFHNKYTKPILAIAGLVAAAVLLLRRIVPEWGAYLLPLVVLGIAAFSRLALFTLIDASAFPGCDPRYLFPAALALTILAVWGLAAGMYSLGRALAQAMILRRDAATGRVPLSWGRRNTLPVIAVAASIALIVGLHLPAYDALEYLPRGPGPVLTTDDTAPLIPPNGHVFMEVPVSLDNPVAINDGGWEGRVLRATGEDPWIVFALPRPQLVTGIRLKLAYERANSPAHFQLIWHDSTKDGPENIRHADLWLPTEPNERTVTVPVHQTLDHIRIDPASGLCIFRLTEVTLLVAVPAEYDRLLQSVRETVRGATPEGAVVLVISKGDDEFLKLEGRIGWHFLRTDDGRWGGQPRDSAHAIDCLIKLRVQGAQYLVLPKWHFWWLEHYKEFNEHLGKHYRVVARREDTCLIYAPR